MTPAQLAARNTRIDSYEAAFTPRLTAALIQSVEPAISAFEQGARPELAAAYVSTMPVETLLAALYTAVLPAEAAVTYELLTAGQKALKAAPTTAIRDSWLQRAVRFIRGEGAQALRALTARTRALVQDALAEAQEAGLSVPDAARALRERVAAVSRERAVLVCRTELNASANYGSFAGAVSTGLKLNKTWLASKGGRTRPSHVAANGQMVPLDALFSVGIGRGRFPGDTQLPVGERARCRCSLTFKPLEP